MSTRNSDIISKTGGYNPEVRDKYLQMPKEEKRKLYKCGLKFVTLDEINPIKTYAMKSVTKRKPQNVPVLQYSDAMFLSDKISIWQGDLTKLEVDAIVNAANEYLLGGGGVDGAIHSAAGKLLLGECQTLNGCQPGHAKITSGYNLPAKYVIHTVGPRNQSPELLKSCYDSSLNLMKSNKLTSIAFPCIATGIFGFPNEPAAKIAIESVLEFLRSDAGQDIKRIIFTVFLDKDVDIYESFLCEYFSSMLGLS